MLPTNCEPVPSVAELPTCQKMLALVDVDDGTPDTGQIAVEVRGAGVNPADAKLYGGAFGTNCRYRCGLEWRLRGS